MHVPEGWVSTTIGKITTVYSGGTPSMQNDTFWGGVHPWITAKDLKKHYLDNSIVTLSDDGFAKAKVAPKGASLILVRGMTLLRDFPVGYASRPMAFNQDIKALLPQKGIDGLFLSFFLVSQKDNIRQFVSTASHGTGKLDTEIIKDLGINLPTFPEQQKIAQILSTWDKAIEKLEALIAAKQKRKKALMQQLLTGKKRFAGFEGEWKYLKANELFKTISQKKNGNGGELLAVTQDQGVLPRSLLERRVVMPDGSTEGYKLVVPGNFIISLRSFQGGLEYSNYRGLVSPAYTVLKPIIKISDDFYRHYFKSYDFIGHLAVAVIGIRDGKQISYEDFSFLKLPYPPIDEQQKIASVLTAADTEIDTHKKQFATLKEQKKGLMQQLLTGKKRVKVEAHV